MARMRWVSVALTWTLWLLVMNLAWEFAHLPLYAFAPDATWREITLNAVHCTLGDGGIALGAYGAGALFTRDAGWPRRDAGRGLIVACMSAAAYTVWSEWRNVYVAGNWTYSAAMPTIAGIGLAPLLQWMLLPPIAWWLMRRRR